MVVMASDGPSPHSPSSHLGLPANHPSRRHHAQSLLGPSFHDPGTHHVSNPGSKLLHETKFQRFLSGKSVFVNSRFKLREFVQVKWSKKKFLKGSVGNEMRLRFCIKLQKIDLVLMQLARYKYMHARV